MAATALATIKNWFKTGLKPTQTQFWATWDSFWHKDENIPIAKIDGLTAAIDGKAEAAQLTAHLTDPEAHPNLVQKERRTNFTPEEDTISIQLNVLIGVEIDGIMVMSQVIQSGFVHDTETGTLEFDFKAGMKHLIFYTIP